MSVLNPDPSLPSNPAPVFADTNAARGDEMRANNNKIWGNFADLDSRIEDRWVRTIYGDNEHGSTHVTDLDAITKSGFYTCLGTATGAPNTTYSWFVLHQNSADGTASEYQRAVAFSTTIQVLERTKISSVWGAWRPSGYVTPKIEGLIISNNSGDPANDINISAGNCMNSLRTMRLSLASTLTKRLDATWSAGNNGGLLQAGQTKSAGRSYRLYLIASADGLTVDLIATEYNIALALPTGYTQFRYMLTIQTDASGAIHRFEHLGNEVVLYRKDMIVNGSLTQGDITQSVTTLPLGLTRPIMKFEVGHASTGAAATYINSILPDGTIANGVLLASGASGDNQLTGQVTLNAAYEFRITAVTTGVRVLWATGYIDRDREAY